MGTDKPGKLDTYSDIASNEGPSDKTEEQDRCRQALSSSLEEIERSTYYQSKKHLPNVDTPVTLQFKKRLVVVTEDGEEIGYLPTYYNYLASCLKEGYSYTGSVISVSTTPILKVQVDLAPL